MDPKIHLTRVIGTCAAALCLAVAAPAFADVIEPSEAACQGKKKGDACDLGGKVGACADAQCCKNDYSQGTPPKSVCGPCQKCQEAGADAGDPAQPNPDTAGETAGASDTGALSGDSGGPTAPAPTVSDKSSGCSAAVAAMPAWSFVSMLIGGLGLLWLRRRGSQGQ